MYINRNKKHGFTMTELIITIAVMGVIAAIAVPSLSGYFRMVRLERLNNYARTVFLASQSYFTSYTGSGNDLESNESYKNNGNKTPAGTIAPRLLPEADAANIYGLKYDTTNREQADNPLREILLYYVTDADIMGYSILIEYNVRTGMMLSAFVSEAAELGYGVPGNGDVGARGAEALGDKLMGYYGVDSTGEAPVPQGANEVQIELVNDGRLLYALLTLPATDGARYTVTVEAGERPTIRFAAEDLRDAAISASMALEQVASGQKKHAICTDPDLTDSSKTQYAIILDTYGTYGAYGRGAPDAFSISERYPDIPAGQVYLSLVLYDARGDQLGAKVFSNFEYSYFTGLEITAEPGAPDAGGEAA